MIGKTEQQDPINHEYLASKYKNELECVLLETAGWIARQNDIIRDLQQKADAYDVLRRVVGLATGSGGRAMPDASCLAISLKRRYEELQAVPVDQPEPTPEEPTPEEVQYPG